MLKIHFSKIVKSSICLFLLINFIPSSYSWDFNFWNQTEEGEAEYAPASLIVSKTPFQVVPATFKEIVRIKKGETISGILDQYKLNNASKYEFIKAIRTVFSPRSFRGGQRLEFSIKLSGDDKIIQELRFYKNNDYIVEVKVNSEGSYVAKERPIVWNKEILYSEGTIISGLYSDGLKAGVPQSIIVKLIEYFSFNVDFQRDLRGGDRFQVVYEKRTDESGQIEQSDNILYANLIMSGQANPIFRYELENGEVVYFNENGESFRRSLLKTPVDGSRISSGFSRRRKHPILGYRRGHKGVDFAVSSGTPIKAAGDGYISKREKSSSYGNYIKIRHSNGYETLYAHMSSFNSSFRKGGRVKQGDIIGYVGCTGLCTGPHLHYEVIYQNRHINPQKLKQPPSLVLKGKEFKNYRGFVENFMSDFKIKWQDDSYTVDAETHAPSKNQNENS